MCLIRSVRSSLRRRVAFSRRLYINQVDFSLQTSPTNIQYNGYHLCWRKYVMICSRFDRQRNRQTDGQTDRIVISMSRVSITLLTRHKNGLCDPAHAALRTNTYLTFAATYQLWSVQLEVLQTITFCGGRTHGSWGPICFLAERRKNDPNQALVSLSFSLLFCSFHWLLFRFLEVSLSCSYTLWVKKHATLVLGINFENVDRFGSIDLR